MNSYAVLGSFDAGALDPPDVLRLINRRDIRRASVPSLSGPLRVSATIDADNLETAISALVLAVREFDDTAAATSVNAIEVTIPAVSGSVAATEAS